MSQVNSKHVEILISGRVQGVFYRASARTKALQLEILGYTENRADGRVKIMASGHPASVQKLIDWCQIGPFGANVKKVMVEDKPMDESYETFEIRD
ncbi:MAG: acylphosphatase [Methylococcaceae bacterium]